MSVASKIARIGANIAGALGYTPVNKAGDTVDESLRFTTSKQITGQNLNTLLVPGDYIGFNLTNSPDSSQWCHVYVRGNGSDQIIQEVRQANYAGGGFWFRESTNAGASWATWVRNGGNVLASAFINRQIVHRRPLSGMVGWSDSSVFGGGSFTRMFGAAANEYGPFGYGVPSLQYGAQRRFRLYAVYSDGSQNNGSPRICIRPDGTSGSQDVNFDFGSTWGDTTTPRDGYSNEIVGYPSFGGAHCGLFATSTSGVNFTMKFYYLELQTLDVWL
jgi:hypothetical protein